ncbi:MAG: T9SS type A sorting domain-containing protein [Flavobacteriales bacterium]|nr:T9SS type A sorting domain-containing protein [Flavobacteriales bacterium]
MTRTLTLPALLVASLAQAQPTITASMLPTGTFTDRLYVVTSQGQSEDPTPGANQVWDLSTATLLDIGTFTHRPAAGTPYASTYPEADLVWHMAMGALGDNYTYLQLTPYLEMLATDVPQEPNVYTDPLMVMGLPLNFGNWFSDSWAGTAGSGSVTWTYAGSGTAITPVGTFNEVALMLSASGEVAMWRTDPLVPLLLVRNGVILAVGPPANVGVDERNDARLVVHPVPCHDRLVVQPTASGPWRIVDLQGRTVAEGRFTSPTSTVVDTEALLPGAYLLVQEGEGAAQVTRFIKE